MSLSVESPQRTPGTLNLVRLIFIKIFKFEGKCIYFWPAISECCGFVKVWSSLMNHMLFIMHSFDVCCSNYGAITNEPGESFHTQHLRTFNASLLELYYISGGCCQKMSPGTLDDGWFFQVEYSESLWLINAYCNYLFLHKFYLIYRIIYLTGFARTWPQKIVPFWPFWRLLFFSRSFMQIVLEQMED